MPALQAMTTRAPDCKWAQRKDKVLFTINVPNLDPAKAKVDITETSFSFQVSIRRDGLSPTERGFRLSFLNCTLMLQCPMAGTEGLWDLKFDFFGEVDPSKVLKPSIKSM